MNKKENKPLLSIIIPVFNETERVANLYQVWEYLKKKKLSNEIIVVDDGSVDDTYKKLIVLQKKFNFKLIRYSLNKGKGNAVKMGMLQAEGLYFLFMDVDLSTPLTEISHRLPYLKKYPVVIGTRKTQQAKLLVRQSLIRENMGKIFTLISRLTLWMSVSDFTCGFKCFTAAAGKEIFIRQTIERWGFDAEILYIAKKIGYQIYEVPVSWKNDRHTKVKFPLDIIRSLFDLIQIRINDFRQVYSKRL